MSFLQGEENCERVVGDDIILPSLFLYPPNFGVGNSWNEIYSKKVEEFRIFRIQKERERETTHERIYEITGGIYRTRKNIYLIIMK